MYQTAIDEIGLDPGSLMFVDDSPVNVEAAVKLGMKGVVISRYGETPETSLPVVTGLDELIETLA